MQYIDNTSANAANVHKDASRLVSVDDPLDPVCPLNHIYF
jgi:hypothetical protein